MQEMAKVIFMLKQSSCCGNHDATFMLSVILSYGISTSVQELLVTNHSLTYVAYYRILKYQQLISYANLRKK